MFPFKHIKIKQLTTNKRSYTANDTDIVLVSRHPDFKCILQQNVPAGYPCIGYETLHWAFMLKGQELHFRLRSMCF